MQSLRFILIVLALLAPLSLRADAPASAPTAADDTAPRGLELVMIEQQGCAWCARWNAEIAPIYPKTEAALRAPLRRVDLHAPLPSDLALARPALFTPTFVLVRDGVEIGRIEGYPGADFFWALLDTLLAETPDVTRD